MKELMPLEDLNPVTVFSEGGLDELLAKIDKEARSHVPDLETDKGRKAIASIAAKVSKSKTYLDGLGKDLVSEWKNQAKVVDNKRKIMRDTLDELKIDVRKPLTEWENEEKERVDKITNLLQEILVLGNTCIEQCLTLSLDTMKENLAEISGEDPDNLREFKDRYDDVKSSSIKKIQESIERREKHDSDQKELEDLRIEKEKRDESDRIALEAEKTAEREENIAKEATEKAEREAKAETDRIEKEKQAAIEAQKAAEKRAVDAEKQAKVNADNAAKAEREKIEKEKQAEIDAAEKREKNTKHKKKINNEAVSSMVAVGLTEKQAKDVVTAIAQNKIKNVSIFY